MNGISDKFSLLSLHELHQCLIAIECENKRLKQQLQVSTKLTNILENIAKSGQMGYELMRKIEINKSCDCNEHLNVELRKSLKSFVDASNTWLDEYQYIKSLSVKSECVHLPDLSHLPHITHIADTQHHTQHHTQHCNVSPMSPHFNFEKHEDKAFSPQSRVMSEHKKSPLFDSIEQNNNKINLKNNKIEPIFVRSLRNISTFDYNNSVESNCGEYDISLTIESNLKHRTHQHLKQFKHNGKLGPRITSNNETRVLTYSTIGTNISQMNEEEEKPNDSAFDDNNRSSCSDIGKYRCSWPDCGYASHLFSDLKRHKYKHKADKNHKCDFEGCSFVTVWKNSLIQHKRNKHFNKLVDHYSNNVIH